MAGTNLKYGSVEIINCSLKDFKEEVVYDDSQTDVVGHRFTVRVSGLVYTHATPNVPISAGGLPPQFKPDLGSAVLTQKRCRALLMHPRQRLVLTFGGQTIFEAKQTLSGADVASGLGDVQNGPKPKSCNIEKVVGSKSLRVEFEIEAVVADCYSGANSKGVLSNRWSVTEDIDQDWYSTREIQGKIVLASPLLGAIGPHTFRALSLPPLEDGFKRVSQHFNATPDGLILEYGFQDKTVAASCPFPGTTWEGTHIESSDDGITTASEIAIKMKGPPNIKSKKPLIGLCVHIGLMKLDIYQQPQGGKGGWRLENAAIVDHLNDTTVEFRISIRKFGTDPAADLGFSTTQLGEWIDTNTVGSQYNRLRSAIPSAYGVASPAGLLVAHFQSICNNDHARHPSGGGSLVTALAPRAPAQTTTGPDGTIFVDNSISSGFSAEHKANIYTHYRMHVEYETQYSRVQLPIASSVGATNDNAAIVSLAKPISRAIVHVTAERIGKWPTLPKAEDVASTVGGGDWRLIEVKKGQVAPQATPSGHRKQALYSRSADYIYAMTKEMGNNMFVGRDPIMNSGVLLTSVPANANDSALFQAGTPAFSTTLSST